MELLSAEVLDEKWKNAAWRGRLRDSSNRYDNLNLRLRRSLSWLRRADEEYYKLSAKAPDSDAADRKPDFDAAFIFYWIAFNAVYELREELHSVSSRDAKTHFAKGAALLRRRTRGVQEGLRAAWQELLDPAKAG